MNTLLTHIKCFIILISLTSCSHEVYENNLVDIAMSIDERPISRKQLVEVFDLDPTDGIVTTSFPLFETDGEIRSLATKGKGSSESWNLSHGYVLQAISKDDLIYEAAEKAAKEWRKTAPKNDYFVLNPDSVEFFDSFRLESSRGIQLYTSELAEQDAAPNRSSRLSSARR